MSGIIISKDGNRVNNKNFDIDNSGDLEAKNNKSFKGKHRSTSGNEGITRDVLLSSGETLKIENGIIVEVI